MQDRFEGQRVKLEEESQIKHKMEMYSFVFNSNVACNMFFFHNYRDFVCILGVCGEKNFDKNICLEGSSQMCYSWLLFRLQATVVIIKPLNCTCRTLLK